MPSVEEVYRARLIFTIFHQHLLPLNALFDLVNTVQVGLDLHNALGAKI